MSNTHTREPIAIIGSACCFPGGCNTPSKLWELLRQPRDILREIPKERFNIDAFYHPDPTHHGTTNVRQSYFLDQDPTKFDAQFFSIPPTEAESIDPQQRLLMETVYESLCAAGLPMEQLRGSSTAVYVGLMCDDWSSMIQKDIDSLPTYTGTGTARSIMSNRLSYFFDWHGPSMTIDTACSSSLVAVHEAVCLLRSGESKVAIAAGANLILSPTQYVAESNLRMLSPTGRSRMWDAKADGYARGEGVASVVLKTLSQAIRDGDTIECIIRETGVNQDGHTSGLTVPSNIAQTNLIRSTYARAGLDLTKAADRPQFFHAHGTGTKAGDPQEAQAIHNAFFPDGVDTSEPLYVGSIKTVIGHTEGTAGLASLIGTSLAICNNTIPPNMHFENLNPDITPYYNNLQVPTVARNWPTLPAGTVKRASINSFGFGGTNAHAIIEAYIPETKILDVLSPSDSTLFTPLVFSAASAPSLRSTLSNYYQFFTANPQISLRDLAWTLQHRQSTLSFRKVISGRDYDDICNKIGEELSGADSKFDTRSTTVEKPKILGVFTGQGAQWPRMGCELLEASPFIVQRIAELDASLATLPKADRPAWTIKEQLMADASSSRVGEAALSQPLCTAVQVVLVDLIEAAGIKFKAVVGHSSGEIGAAYAAGLISAHDAIRIAYYRGLHTKVASSPNHSKGAMVAVGMAPDEAEELCEREELRGRISVAAYNSLSSSTLSGDEDAIDEAIEMLKKESKFARRLKVDTAYHSAHMRTCAEPYLQSLNQCNIKPLKTTGDRPSWFSSVSEDTVMTLDLLDNQYWINNMTQPVLFSSAVITAADAMETLDLAIEIGPHPALKGPAMDNLAEVGMVAPYTGLLSRGKDDVVELSSALGFIWSILGAGSINFDGFDKAINADNATKTVLKDLPSYPFNHQHSYWAEPRTSSVYKQLKTKPNPVLGMPIVSTTTSGEAQWKNMLTPKEVPWLQGHKLQDQIIFPATGYIAMAIEALQLLAGEVGLSHIKIEDLILERAMAFNDEHSTAETLFSVKYQESADTITATFGCYSCPEGDRSMIKNATGRIQVRLGKPTPDSLPFFPPQNRFNMVNVSIDRFYSVLSKIGYHYSEPFKGMSDVKRKMGVACGLLIDQSGSAWEDQLVIHPGMLDTALQTLFAAFSYPGDESLRSMHIPVSIDSLAINPYFSLAENRKQLSVPWEAVVRDEAKSDIMADVQLLSEDAQHTFVQIEGVTLKPFTAARPQDDVTLFSHFEYLRDRPDGEIAAMGERLSPEELRVAKDMERLAFFYLRQVSEMPAEDRANALPHHQHLMAWGDYTVDKVRKGEHLSVDVECLDDTLEDILVLTDKYRNRVDALLIETTGQNLPATIRAKASILEHMTKDNLLGRFYEEGIGLTTANWWLAKIAKQISHRYPHTKILEIGAGTGGITQATLPSLGTSFSSYTYTDVSSAFFEAAEEKFKDYADRMIFKVFDMVKSPAEQGFTEGSYDMVLASNVLHVAEDLDVMMTNVRKLVKPGGFLVNLETVTNDMLRNGIIMGGLPGWWIGADSGRPHGPMLSLESWQGLLKRCGFGGIETSTPIYDNLHAVAVWAAQAIDDRVKILKSPSTALRESFKPGSHLVLIGGKSLSTYALMENIKSALISKFSSFKHIPSIEALSTELLPFGSTVLNLADLDEPVMKSFTEGKMNGLKALWVQGRNILWVTKGARYEDPYAYMMFGIGRVVRFENPNINLQLLDVDSIGDQVGQYITDALLNHKLLDDWRVEGNLEQLLWSSEPEIFLEQDRTLIPRLYPNKAQNARVNSARRKIFMDVDPATTTLRLVSSGDSVDLEGATALELMAIDTEKRQMRVTRSILQSIKVGDVGNLMLCVGFNPQKPSVCILALSDLATSPAPIVPACTLEIPSSAEFSKMALISVAAQLVAQQVISSLPKGSTVLVHEADKLLKTTISSKAKAAVVTAIFTTCQPERRGTDCNFIHTALPTRLLKKQVPSDVSVFVDFSVKGSSSAEIGRAISKLLPAHCLSKDFASFFGNTPQLRSGASISEAEAALKQAWKDATSTSVPIEEAGVISLSTVSLYHPAKEPLTVVDWTVSTVPVRVRPIDNRDIFRSDRTYLLIGLSGEVGQSLCQWMIHHGARHVVLASRRPVVDPEFIKSLESQGANIRAMSLDITSRESLTRCVDSITRTMPKIAGVSNGALIVADSPFTEMDLEDMNKVLRPKVDGSILLDEIFQDEPLDFFIMFSSLTACLGNSGQSNYAAANMFTTTLAFQRRKRGVAGSVIDLSSLMGIGHVGRSDVFDADYFRSLGATSVSETDLHQMFAGAIDVGRPDSTESAEIVTGMSPMLRSELEDTKIQYRMDQKFSHFCIEQSQNLGQASSTSKVSVRVLLKGVKSRCEARTILLESFIARIKKVLQIPADEVVDENEVLVERGVDSLVALDIRSWFMRELDVDMPVLKVLGGNSIVDLINDSMERMPASMLDTSALTSDSDVGVARQAKSKLEVPRLDAAASSTTFNTPAYSSQEEASDSISSVDDASIKELSWRESIILSSSEVTEPMSFGQTRFWFLHHALQDQTTFNVAISINLKGHLQHASFEQALQAVAEKHEAMRTRYFWSGKDMDVPTQGVLSRPLIKLEHRAISAKSDAAKALEEMRDFKWDLGDWESMRFVLLTLSEDTHWIIFGCHHITIDGVGIQLIFADLEKAYQGQRLMPLPETAQYRKYSALQRKHLENGGFQKDIDFYRNIIPANVQPISLLPFSNLSARQPQKSYRSHRSDIRLDAAITARIKQVARQNQSTNFHLYLAVLQALLFRLLPETKEIFIGIADANRNNNQFMETLGFFLNLLPIRFDRPTAKAKFSAIVKAARNKTYAVLEHSDLPFDVLLNELGIDRSANSSPVFQVFVDYRQGTQERAKFANLDAAGEEWYHPRTGYDISVDILENAEGDTLVTLQLQQSLYTQEHTDLLLRSYVNLLKGFTKTAGRDIQIDAPSLWDEEDVSFALQIGKGPQNPLEWPETVSHRIDQMIAAHGSEPALKDGRGRALTYTEMGRRVDSIAASLIEAGISDGVVGVLQEPSSDWICSMLAIFKVGATYLPLDLRNSIHRLHNAVKTGKPTALLVDPTTLDVLKTVEAPGAKVIDVSTISSVSVHKATAAHGDAAAVILFTSGSTGEPKGIVIKHSNLVAQNEGFSKQFVGKVSNVLQQSALSFDFSLEQIFVALCNGGCLHVVPPEKRGDPYEVTKLMLDEGINYTSGTPSEYEMWFQHGQEHLKHCHQWKYAFFGGEPFLDDFISEFRGLGLPCLRLFNNYGPGETTIACTHRGEIQYNDRNLKYPLPAGFPAQNYALHIVDAQLNVLPVGVPGEILVGGAGVSAGYLGLDAVTREKFVPNPFKDAHFAANGWTTVYRTGDRGRLRDDGALLIDGRIDGDTQVKIRGFRVELAEIESVILEIAKGALKHAVVTVRESAGTKFLAAHVVFSRHHPDAGRIEFLDGLQAQLPLPDYMRPAVIVVVDKLPLTAHSKFDRAAIKALHLDSPLISRSDIAGNRELTPIEARLAELWKSVLPVVPTAITPESNFFHVGGSSLLLVRLQRIIKREFSAAPKLVELMNAGKLSEMAVVTTAALSGRIDWDVETAVPESWKDDFPFPAAPAKPRDGGLNVLLTGATGYLGRHLVPALVQSKQVAKLFCIVRRETDIEALSAHDKVVIFTGDLGDPNLGLTDEEFTQLASESDVILHSGANRSFWDDYEVLRPVNTSSVKELTRLALPRRLPLHYVSSGSVRIYGSTSGASIYNIDESQPAGDTPPEDGTDGYVASKWASEVFLRKVTAQFNLSVTLHTPMPVSGYGPDDSHAEPEPDHMLHELVEITKRLQVRPTMEGLGGWADIVPTEIVVRDILQAIFEEPRKDGGDSRIFHTGVRRINWQRFIAELQNNPELNTLPSKDTLLWIGQAKRSGYSYFMPAHRLVVLSEEGDMVSRR